MISPGWSTAYEIGPPPDLADFASITRGGPLRRIWRSSSETRASSSAIRAVKSLGIIVSGRGGAPIACEDRRGDRSEV
jgi:hypothetical protein